MLTFDKSSSTAITFPFPCSHDLYKDAADAYVLVCKGFLAAGGVSVNELALDHVLGLPGPMELKQVWLKSTQGWVWEGRAEDLPNKEAREGNGKYPGLIRIYDRADLYPEQLPFSSMPTPRANLPVVTAQPVVGEISFDEFKTWLNATFTNPTLQTLLDKSRIHPFSLHIEGGNMTIVRKK